jgi:O-antigen ligase
MPTASVLRLTFIGASLYIAACLTALAYVIRTGGDPAVALIVALTVVVGVVIIARPITSGWTLACLSYLFGFPITITVFGVADIRPMSVAWLAVWVGMLARPAIFREARGRGLPRYILLAAAVLLVWEVVCALAAGGGKPLVEVVQYTYFILVAQTAAVLVGLAPQPLLAKWARLAGFVFLFVLLVNLPGYLHFSLRIPLFEGTFTDGLRLAPQADYSLSNDLGKMPRFDIAGLGPVATAAVCIAAIAIALPVVLDPRAKRKRLPTVVVIAAVLATLMTLSRAAWLIGVLLACVIALRAGFHKFFILFLVVIAIAALALSVPLIADRVEDLTDFAEPSYLGHASLYKTGINKALESPVFGWGPGTFKSFEYPVDLGFGPLILSGTDTHNLFLQELAETGIPGFVLLGLFLISVLLGVRVRGRGTRLSLHGPAFALWGVLFMAMTMNIFRTEFFWVLLGIGVGLAVRCRRQGTEEIWHSHVRPELSSPQAHRLKRVLDHEQPVTGQALANLDRR